MFSSFLLKGALAALTVLEIGATSADDINNYPIFADAMTAEGSNFGWKSYPLTSGNGYNLIMFRVTEDATGTPLTPTKGPILLVHGMFSSPTDFLGRSDSGSASLPIQLAQMGYDVWIGCSRGRPYTDTHTVYDLNNPDEEKSYWDYTYEEIGK